MKRIVLLALLALTASGAFAQGLPFGMGGGVLLDDSFSSGFKSDSADFKINKFSYGGFIFFDASYVEADIYVTSGAVNNHSINYYGGSEEHLYFSSTDIQLGFSLLGKYPIDLGSIIIFPLLGVSYNVVLSHKNEFGEKLEKPSEWSQFGLSGGIGFDFYQTNSLYFRIEALFQILFPSKVTRDQIDSIKSGGENAKAALGFGPVIKMGVGYRF